MDKVVSDYSFPGEHWDARKGDVSGIVKSQLEASTGDAADALFVEYVMTMLGNAKKMSEMASELKDFLGEDDAIAFTSELGKLLMERYPRPSTPAVTTVNGAATAPAAKKGKAKPVVKSKAVAVGQTDVADEIPSSATSRSAASIPKVENVRMLNNALKQSMNPGATKVDSRVKVERAAPTSASAQDASLSAPTRPSSSTTTTNAVSTSAPIVAASGGFSTAALRESSATGGAVGISTADLRKSHKRGLMSASAAAAEAAAEAALLSDSHSTKFQRTENHATSDGYGTVFGFAGYQGRGDGSGRGGKGARGGGRSAPRGRGGRVFGRGRGSNVWVAGGDSEVPVGDTAAEVAVGDVSGSAGEGSALAVSDVGGEATGTDAGAADAAAASEVGHAPTGGRFGAYAARGGRSAPRGRCAAFGRGAGRGRGPPPKANVWVNPDVAAATAAASATASATAGESAGDGDASAPISSTAASFKTRNKTWVRDAGVESSLVHGR